MKKSIIIAALFLGLVFNLNAQTSNIQCKKIPEFTLIDNYGKTITSADYAGNLLIIDFWSPYCRPCIKLGREVLRPLYQTLDSSNFKILSICTDKDTLAWLDRIEAEDFNWEQVNLTLNQNTTLSDYNVKLLPTTFLVDTNGCIIGKDLEKNELLNKISYELEIANIVLDDTANIQDIDIQAYKSEMLSEIEEFIYENTIYPQEAEENNITDSITIKLKVGKDSKIEFVDFENPDNIIGYGCEDEVFRLVSLLRYLDSYNYIKENSYIFAVNIYFPPKEPENNY